MKRYTVVWDETVEADFLSAWLRSQSEERQALTEIANTIDQSLSTNAESKGQQQPDEATRAIIIGVLSANITVFYEVLSAEHRVLVRRLVFRRAD